jgi:hypothetical protein
LRKGNIDCIRRIDELEGGAFEDEFRHLMEVGEMNFAPTMMVEAVENGGDSGLRAK